MSEKKFVLSFGHLPIYAGGKQSSGLANVIWKIADEINATDSSFFEILVSTDIHQEETIIDSTLVLGWNIQLLFKAILKYPFTFVCLIVKALRLKINYAFPFFNSLAKMLFFNYVILNRIDKISIIHIHGVNNYFLFRNIIKDRKLKSVVTIHGITGWDPNIGKYLIQRKLENLLTASKYISNIVYITNSIYHEWVRIYGKPFAKTNIILNGVDTIKFNLPKDQKRKDNSRIHLLSIGSISTLKGQFRVMEAICKLSKNRITKFTYSVIGNSSDNDIYKLNNIAISNHIEFKFLGYKQPDEIRTLLWASDYMILPSSTEGFGLVFLESIACGTPVIIPKTLPLAKELGILNEINSIFIDDHTSESIRKCLETLKHHPYSNIEVAKTVEKFSWNRIAKEYLKLFEEI